MPADAANASQPACWAALGGSPANGFPRSVIAWPQTAIRQLGSASATWRNATPDSSHQNECSRAKARSKRGCAWALQDVGKCTLPSRSGGWPPCSWVTWAEAAWTGTNTPAARTPNRMAERMRHLLEGFRLRGGIRTVGDGCERGPRLRTG